MRIVIGSAGPGRVVLVDVDVAAADDSPADETSGVLAKASADDLPALVARFAPERPRWVWRDTREWYPRLLDAGYESSASSICGCAARSSSSRR
ncbi:hypothetical protein [Agromyces protaetiae]|uniref:hypothetical protein n=1 Tax=Agromyces protaetiae TaxID=2509455 RepID=UPI0026AB402B